MEINNKLDSIGKRHEDSKEKKMERVKKRGKIEGWEEGRK